MIRFVVRLIGFLSMAAGFVSLVVDGTRSIAMSSVTVTPLGSAWHSLSPGTLDLVQRTASRVSPWLWDPVLVTALFTPVFVLLGGLGFLLLMAGRRPKELIGWSSRG